MFLKKKKEVFDILSRKIILSKILHDSGDSMKGYLFPKGSEWRKWDLHVHTPASFHWKGQRFATMTPEEKKESFKTMLDTINNSEVSVFGIMDYWTFDGYLEFMKMVKNEGWELKKTVLPGMELRIESPTDYRLNIHVILSNLLTEQQLIDFKSHLKLRLVDRPISIEALISLSDELGRDKKRIHGFNDPDNMCEDDKLKFGSMVAEVTKESLVKAMKTIPQNSGYVLLPYDTSDGLSDLDWESFPVSDTFFLRFAHIFETRKQQTLDLFIGKKTPQNEKFIGDFQATLGKVHKPGIAGSDAHAFSDYGNYPSNKMTWIKADPNFNGLRQIIHEPETRVCISQNKPNQKTSYLVIDKVKFCDNRQPKEFNDAWIELNDGLNVIIGGKSSGKSLLLHCIAKTIDPKQVNDKVGGKVYDFEIDPNFNFEVKWLDSSTNYLKEEVEKKAIHQITYIPQLYIHQLAEEKGQEKLRELILNILLQNNVFGDFYREQMEKISTHFADIDKEIISLFNTQSERYNISEGIKKLGDKASITSEIQKIEAEITQLRISSGFSEQEVIEYNTLIIKRNENEKEINRLNSLKKAMQDFEKEVLNVTDSYIKGLLHQIELFKNQFVNDEKSSIYANVVANGLAAKAIPLVKEVKASVTFEEINSLLSSSYEDKDKINIALLPFNEKFANRNRLETLQKSLEKQNKLLNDIYEHEKLLSIATEKYNQQFSNIIQEFTLMLEIYANVNEELNKPHYHKISDDMKLNSEICFDNRKFFKQFTDLFNRQKKLHRLLSQCFNENDEFIFDSLKNHIVRVKLVFENIMSNEEFKLKNAYELKTVVLALFSNYYYFDFNLIQKNDGFMHMSPGKRGLVLLQLFLHLSNSTHPILIDQPEDNLDNRTIYTELNEFVKSKKVNRQIIIVTHNANLVVLTDAEQVIVANQAGQQAERENEKYRFEYVSGSLECSFTNEEAQSILLKKGIKEHVCEILEGGQEAFEKRERKYGF